MENHVTSLELSKKLKELGVKQESLFWWQHFDEMVGAGTVQKVDYWRVTDGAYRDGFISAFLSSELGEMLPSINWQTYKEKGKWILTNHQNTIEAVEEFTESNCRAKMLIYLIENNIIDVKSL